MSVELDRVSKRFGEFIALDEVTFSVSEGELVALVGPSGSGKSTLLRVVAGLERQDAGRRADPRRGRGAARPGRPTDRLRVPALRAVPAHDGVRERRVRAARAAAAASVRRGERDHAAVKDLLSLVELDALGARYPSELSGGQQQRVALARALAVQPRVLLLDEPFGALDARVREQLRQWLRQLHDEVKVTTILVTHDSEEACEVADRVAVMHEGRIAQIGTAAELMREPANPFLERFWRGDAEERGRRRRFNYH